ncbi:hypothetical protein RIF29_42084 [Crotalaria pallida]|uniref:Uncharacterized protein n=1 Tax=Crotalaria pallida TaxID=3830 RepID=A0AAN9EC98_CROPI
MQSNFGAKNPFSTSFIYFSVLILTRVRPNYYIISLRKILHRVLITKQLRVALSSFSSFFIRNPFNVQTFPPKNIKNTKHMLCRLDT